MARSEPSWGRLVRSTDRRMLIGAHVSPAGGLPQGGRAGRRARLPRDPDLQPVAAHVETDAPTATRTSRAFREAMAASPIDAVLIHAVYLLNCASEDPDIRAQIAGVADPLAARRAARSARRGVVLHPGSAKTGDVGARDRARRRDDRARRSPRARAARCTWRTPPAPGGTLGRSFEELAALLEARGADERLGVCLDSCHLFASGYDIRTPAGVDALSRESRARLGLGRIGSLHLNDSQTPLGSNRDRHANIGAGRARRARAAPRSCRRPRFAGAAVRAGDARRRTAAARPREEVALAMRAARARAGGARARRAARG